MRIYILIQGESHQTYFSVKFKFSKGLEYNFSVKNKHIIILVHSPYKVSKTKHFRKINVAGLENVWQNCREFMRMCHPKDLHNEKKCATKTHLVLFI